MEAPVSHSLSLRICDTPVLIEGISPALDQRLSALMQPFFAPFDETTTPLTLELRDEGDETAIVRDGAAVAAYGDHRLLLTQIEWHAIAMGLQDTTRYAAIHGAALVRGSSVVLLLADSGAGKTTLTLGLMRRGWLPLTDDVILVDAQTLAVQPFPRCFHVDDAARELAADESQIEWPGDIAEYARPLRWAQGGLAPTAVLVVERCAPCGTRLQPLTLAEAAGAIVQNNIRTGLSKAQVANAAARLAMGVRTGAHLKNGRFADTLALIEHLAGQ
jgi:hypothetical protein